MAPDLTAQQRVNLVHALTTTLAVALELLAYHRQAGNVDAAEGCQQTVNRAAEQITAHLQSIKEAIR